MSHLFFCWLHHSNNYPTGFTFCGIPLFVINRLAKVCLFSSALVIVLEIIGPDQTEANFKRSHERLSNFIGKHHIKQVIQELSNTISVFAALFRTVSRKNTTQIDEAARKKIGPVFRLLGVGMLLGFGLSALLVAVSTLVSFSNLSDHVQLVSKLFYGLMFFALITGIACFLITIAAFLVSVALWALALILRPLEAVLKATTSFILRKVNDKGAAQSWRMASLTLLALGFFLDFFTS